MKRALLGLLAGLVVWGSLTLLLLATKSYDFSYDNGEHLTTEVILYYLIYVMEIAPVLLGSALAGYFAGRLGLVLSVILGTAHGVIIYMRWAGGWYPDGIASGASDFVVWYAPAGLLGAYLGLRLARFRRRRSRPPRKEMTSSDMESIGEENRIESNRVKGMPLGLAAGLTLWGVLRLVGLWQFGLRCWPSWFSPPPIVFISSVLAGYCARRNGFTLGGTIGLVDFGLMLGVLHTMQPLSDLLGTPMLLLLLLAYFGLGFFVLPGVLGGYFGERLARFRLRRSNLSN